MTEITSCFQLKICTEFWCTVWSGKRCSHSLEYPPMTGRFITPDQLWFIRPQDDPFVYASHDPVNGMDPSGLQVTTSMPSPSVAEEDFNLWLWQGRIFSTRGMWADDSPPGSHINSKGGGGENVGGGSGSGSGVVTPQVRMSEGKRIPSYALAHHELSVGRAYSFAPVTVSAGLSEAEIFSNQISVIMETLNSGTYTASSSVDFFPIFGGSYGITLTYSPAINQAALTFDLSGGAGFSFLGSCEVGWQAKSEPIKQYSADTYTASLMGLSTNFPMITRDDTKTWQGIPNILSPNSLSFDFLGLGKPMGSFRHTQSWRIW